MVVDTYSHLFLDFDGTVNAHGARGPSSKVLRTLRAAQDRIPFSFLTGASYDRIQKFLPRSLFSGMHAFLQGAQLYDGSREQILREHTLTEEQIERARHNLSLLHYHLRIWKDSYSTHHLPMGASVDEVDPHVAENLQTLLSQDKGITVNFGVSNTDNRVNVSIHHKKATKEAAMVDICRRLKIDISRTIGIGDGPNDIEFLKLCGLKVAMGNAIPAVKAMADYIAPADINDGVVEAIETFILK